MNLDRAIQVNTAALAVLGALFLGLGHESLVLPVALGLAAVISVTLASVFRWLRLNRIIANIVALVAVAWSLRNFLRIGSEGQLLAIADMLVYLQIVLLFQEKSSRVYWQLIVLSLLQVVVAAALNLGPQFGFLLAAYMALAICALVLLCLQRQGMSLAVAIKAGSGPAAPWRMLLGRPHQVIAAGVPPEVAMGIRPLTVARQVVLLAVATLAFAGVYFYATPRLPEGAWSGSRGGTHSVTGFSLEASLEESGRVHQSNQLVMRVALSNAIEKRPYPMIGEPYFHGLALADYTYDGGGGRWTARLRPRTAPKLTVTPQRSYTASGIVRSDIMLEGQPQQFFAVLPVHRIPAESPPNLEFNDFAYRLVRKLQSEDGVPRRELRYVLGTTSLRNGRQIRGVPHHNPLTTSSDGRFLERDRADHLAFDEQRFGALAAVASQVVREEGLEAAGPLEKAIGLERHFHALDRYRYSLSLDFARDPKLDPIEDFVANHHTGHCEYFASALVMMLRSQGIPARMIVGYKGGDFNSIGNYYQVRQKHAHAWVEALLPADAVPEWELAGRPSGGGAWFRLDPTPAPLGQLAAADEGALDRLIQTFDYVELMWRDYVLGLNAVKQHDALYEPVSSSALAALPAWTEGRGFRRMMRRLAGRLGLNVSPPGRGPADSPAFDWRTGTLVVLLILIAVVLGQGLLLAIHFLRRWRSARGGAAHRRQRTPRFYVRLESLLARLHLRRASGQTAQEFAAAAANKLNRGGPDATAALPAEIVAAYYRVRFGGAALDTTEQAAIEQALAQLTPAVNQARQ